jgi:hypothetical protein
MAYDGGKVDYDYDDDDGERFAEYEKVRQRMPFVRHGSEGYEVRPIDREQLLAEYIVYCIVRRRMGIILGMCLNRRVTLRARVARVVGGRRWR